MSRTYRFHETHRRNRSYSKYTICYDNGGVEPTWYPCASREHAQQMVDELHGVVRDRDSVLTNGVRWNTWFVYPNN